MSQLLNSSDSGWRRASKHLTFDEKCKDMSPYYEFISGIPQDMGTHKLILNF